MKYIQICCKCNTKDRDAVCAIMSVIEPHLMIEDFSDIGEIDTCYGELIDEELLRADRDHCRVSLFITEDKNPAEYTGFLSERFSSQGIECDINVEGIDEKDWENEWKKYYFPVHIGNKLVIVPAWQEYRAEQGEVTVLMDPGLAFGTGTHETTQLCAKALEKYLVKGSRMLDVGCGSVFLSIAAKKMGAVYTFGCDIDPVAVRVAKENARANGVGCEYGVSDLLKGVKGKYDIMCANIVADILIRMAPDAPDCLNDGGIIIASGIIADRCDEVLKAMCDSGFELVETDSENDWRALILKKL